MKEIKVVVNHNEMNKKHQKNYKYVSSIKRISIFISIYYSSSSSRIFQLPSTKIHIHPSSHSHFRLRCEMIGRLLLEAEQMDEGYVEEAEYQ
jgi:hypothetical protein